MAASTAVEFEVGPGAARSEPSAIEGRWHGARISFAVIGSLAAIGLFFLLDQASAHIVAVNTDNATAVLEGQSMASGHLALGGWALSLDSFWTVDVPFYALAVRLFGVEPALMFAVPAIIAVSVIATAVALAVDGAKRRRVPAALAVLGLLALPSPALSFFLLQGPWHVATALWCLLAFAGLRRGRVSAGWVLAVVFLALGLLGDAQMLPLGILPTLAAGLVRAARRRSLRAAAAPLSAPVVAVVAALVARQLAKAVGSFTVSGVNPIARGPQMFTNLGHVGKYGAAMLGLGSFPVPYGSIGQPVAFQAAHLLGIALVLAGVLTAALALLRATIGGPGRTPDSADDGFLDDVLVLAVLADVATFVLIDGTVKGDYARYLTPGLVFASVLAGRLVARGPTRATTSPHWRTRSAAVVGALALVAFGAGFIHGVAQPASSPRAQALGRFLADHHLEVGIGDYWSSSLVTVETSAAVTVRPVIRSADGRLVRYDKQSSDHWYTQPFQFLVFDTARPWGRVNATSASATFGPPSQVLTAGTYRVLVWSHDVTIGATGVALR